MKLEIEMPKWGNELFSLKDANFSGLSAAQDQWLCEWFQDKVEPLNKLLSEGVEVYGNPGCCNWRDHDPDVNDIDYNHSAILINIHPIKQESALDVLRDIVDDVHGQIGNMTDDDKKLYDRAKAAIERGEL